jgi:hypothetical protein
MTKFPVNPKIATLGSLDSGIHEDSAQKTGKNNRTAGATRALSEYASKGDVIADGEKLKVFHENATHIMERDTSSRLRSMGIGS